MVAIASSSAGLKAKTGIPLRVKVTSVQQVKDGLTLVSEFDNLVELFFLNMLSDGAKKILHLR